MTTSRGHDALGAQREAPAPWGISANVALPAGKDIAKPLFGLKISGSIPIHHEHEPAGKSRRI
jgi:hypothetical protein